MPTPSPIRRVLIIRPSALGDVARSVPLLVNLRRAFPQAALDWLVQDTFSDMIRYHPDLHEAIPFPRKDFGNWVRGAKLGALFGFLRSLRDRRYDLVIDAQGLLRSGLITRATKAPRRHGSSSAREMGPLKYLAYTHVIPTNIETHTVDQMVGLVTPLLQEQLGQNTKPDTSPAAMRLYTSDADRAWATAALDKLARRSLVVLAPMSRWPGKQWPDERFAQLARHLQAQGHAVALVGSASEATQIPHCLNAFSSPASLPLGKGTGEGASLNLLGQTTIAQLMAIIERAALVVANDSAALHIAVGFNRPTVALFGPTRVHRAGPYKRPALQHVTPLDRMGHKDEANGRELMARITLEEVIAACDSSLSTPPRFD